MKLVNKIGSCLAFAIFASSCGSNNLPDYVALGELKILTLIVDSPEVNPGATVNITPILSDLNGKGRTLNYSVKACIDPGIGLGLTPSCTAPDPSSIKTGTAIPPEGNSRTFTGPVSSFSITVPDSALIFRGRNESDQYNGVSYLVFYSVSASNGDTVNSFVRVTVSASTKVAKNANPVITSVNMNGAAVADPLTMPSSSATFKVIHPESSKESYFVMQKNGSLGARVEELIQTWFISDGKFDFFRTTESSENIWAPPESKPANRGSVIFVVSRDGRGGAVYQKIEMN